MRMFFKTYLLKAHETKIQGLTPLHLALRQQTDSDVYDAAEMLIKAQAKVNTVDDYGQEPIQYAYRNT